MATPPDGRFDLDTANIIELPLPVFVEYDYTHPDVAAEYAAQIQIIYDIFNRARPVDPTTGNTAPSGTAPLGEDFITDADAAAVTNALNTLRALAQSGLVRNNTDFSTKTFFLTKEMATNLDLLIRSFKAVGADVTPGSVTVTDTELEKWKDLSVTSPVIQNILEVAIAAIPTNRSLQALIELEYVRTGNELIEDKFTDLESALTITQQLLDSLARLQDIRNRQVVRPPGSVPLILQGPGSVATDPPGPDDPSPGVYVGQYRSTAERYFNTPVAPIVPSTLIIYGADGSTILGLTNTGVQIFNDLISIKRSLMLFVPRLSAIADPATLADPNSLYNRVKTLLGDFSTTFGVYNGLSFNPAETLSSTNQGLALAQFLLDNQNTKYSNVTGRTPGDSQQNLTFTITSAQGLNDQQKEQVRQFLFVFEEFYKSAAAMLQRITQIIEKMAQNISR